MITFLTLVFLFTTVACALTSGIIETLMYVGAELNTLGHWLRIGSLVGWFGGLLTTACLVIFG